MKKLRILAFGDLHGDERALNAISKKAKKADILLCAGDVTVFENRILYLMKKLDKIGKPVLIIHGNHEDPLLLAEICSRLKNVRFIHRKAYCSNEFPGYLFVGHGGEGFTYQSHDFERFEKQLMPKLRKQLKGRKLILMTHQPPYNTKVDFIWTHHGNKSYTKFIRKTQPVLAVCGHLHETQGKKDKIGKTRIINPDPKGQIVEI